MAATRGMIFLETEHLIIKNVLRDRLKHAEKPEALDVKAADFDGVGYHILVDPKSKDKITLSVQMRALKELKMMGAQGVLDSKFSGMALSKPASGYDLTLEFTNKHLKDKKDLIKNLACIKSLLASAPFRKCFEALASGGAAGMMPMIIPYRNRETIYLVPSNDRVLAVFSVYFEDEADRAIASVFLQEFAEAQRHVSNAPNCSFSTTPGNDLTKVRGFKESRGCVGYVTFQVFKSHVEGAKLDRACTMFAGFRNYLHYHIKASKSHLHSRMRGRVALLLKTLNRANPEVLDAELKSTRTKTFARKV